MNKRDESPALKRLLKGYPPAWMGKVPLKIRMLQTVRSDFPFISPVLVALKGNVYEAWVNSYGSVAAIIQINGDEKLLGVKPDEFEIIEWHNG